MDELTLESLGDPGADNVDRTWVKLRALHVAYGNALAERDQARAMVTVLLAECEGCPAHQWHNAYAYLGGAQ